jgi:hypothetical protein
MPAGRITLVPVDISAERLANVITEAAARGRQDPRSASVPTWDDAVTRTLGIYSSIASDHRRLRGRAGQET